METSSTRAASTEQIARKRIDLVNISCGKLRSSNYVSGRQISDEDVHRVYACHRERTCDLIYCIAIGYSLDGTNRGMFGSPLGVNLHTVMSLFLMVYNLHLVGERCYLDVKAILTLCFCYCLLS
ncbi:Cell division protein FtsA [invertebrate metagenome]|uniref:Cell division protein FtsA n=1 Tax=invertebrate metagenome TaxID=1711999 RepID=A0A484H4W4_9ZZZZ